MKWFLVWFGLTIVATSEAAKTMGPVGNIIVQSIFDCPEKPQSDDVSLNVEFKSIDNKGTKVLSANITTKIPLDNSWTYNLAVSKWVTGWRDFYNTKGSLCTDLDKLITKLWAKVKSSVVPRITTCPIKSGNYVLKNFQASSKDVSLPAIFYGKFQLKFTGYKKGKTIFCLDIEGESQAP